MYAIIADGGRQYKVEEGQELDIDLRDAASGDEITFDQVLAVSGDDGVQVGQPVVEGAETVTAEVLAEVKGEKIYVQKFRRRKDSKRRTGHRQRYTRIRVSKDFRLSRKPIVQAKKHFASYKPAKCFLHLLS